MLFGFAEVAEDGAEFWGNLASVMTPIAAYGYLVFNLLCAPCFAAMGAIKREMNNTKWFWFAIGYQCGLALHCFHVHLPDWYTDHNRTFWIRYSRSIPLCDRIHLSAVPSVQGERDFERKRKECCKGKVIRQKAGDRYGNICCRSNFGIRCVPDRAQHDS